MVFDCKSTHRFIICDLVSILLPFKWKIRFFVCYFGIFCVQFHGVHVQCINIGGGKGEIPDNKHMQIALQHIHGIGRSRARQILSKLSIENKLARELTGRELYALREELNNYMCAHELVNFSYSLLPLLSLSPSRRLQVFGKRGYSHCSDKIKKRLMCSF